MLTGLGRLYAGVEIRRVPLAGGEGFVLYLNAKVLGVIGMEISAARITELNLVVNPAKLRRFSSPPDAGPRAGTA